MKNGPIEPFFNQFAAKTKHFLAGWLIHDLIEDKAIKEIKQETPIGNNIVYRSCVSTNNNVAWLSFVDDNHHLSFLHYDLVDKTRRTLLIQEPSESQFAAAATNNKDFYCICFAKNNIDGSAELLCELINFPAFFTALRSHVQITNTCGLFLPRCCIRL